VTALVSESRRSLIEFHLRVPWVMKVSDFPFLQRISRRRSPCEFCGLTMFVQVKPVAELCLPLWSCCG
jgi:hypothetical protein